MRIAVCGVGLTGLVTAVVLCEFGHSLFCHDINPQFAENLRNIGFSEPGLTELVTHHQNKGTLHFIPNLSEALKDIDAIFVTIPVKGEDGQDMDLSSLIKLFSEISSYLQTDKYLPIFIKTTLPVGTSAIIANNMSQMRPDLLMGVHYDIISNPNFMREGSAIHDLMKPDRIIFGLSQLAFRKLDCSAKTLIENVFSPLKHLNIPFLYTNYETAELIKSATMGLVTIKMAYANEIEQLCNNVGVDLQVLLKGIGSDRRISSDSLLFNAGIGGSSLPRTSRLLIDSAKKFGTELSILSTALESNDRRIQSISKKVLRYFHENFKCSDQKVAIFGISFKPLTDDVRESPSLSVIRDLLRNKIKVSLYDPYYSSKPFNVQNIPYDIMSNNDFSICSSAYNAVSMSDAIVVMTSWPQFRELDMNKIRELMVHSKHTPLLFDCNNMFRDYESTFQYIAA